MANVPRRLYWDACVFLSYINRHPGRIGTLDKLMADGAKGELEILTSTISNVEVAYGIQEQTQKALDPAVEANIDKLWNATSFIKLVEFHALIAQRARTLMRDGIPYGWKLKPGDAIHLATASSGLEIVEFNTYTWRTWNGSRT